MIHAFVFPGQGVAPHRTELRPAPTTEHADDLLRAAARAARVADVDAFHARGGAALERAEVLCPLLVAVAIARWPSIEPSGEGVRTVLLGHSLGELSALSVAGVLAADDAIALAAERGRALDRAATSCRSGLYAVGRDQVARALELGGGSASIALDNADDEVVLGAPEPVLSSLATRIPGRRLRVAGAFHTEWMRPARDALARALRATRGSRPNRPVLSAITLRFVESPSDAVEALLEGITSPVRFREATRILASMGELSVRLLPPVGAMRALVRKNLPDARSQVVP